MRTRPIAWPSRRRNRCLNRCLRSLTTSAGSRASPDRRRIQLSRVTKPESTSSEMRKTKIHDSTVLIENSHQNPGVPSYTTGIQEYPVCRPESRIPPSRIQEYPSTPGVGLTGSYETPRIAQAEVRFEWPNSILVRMQSKAKDGGTLHQVQGACFEPFGQHVFGDA